MRQGPSLSAEDESNFQSRRRQGSQFMIIGYASPPTHSLNPSTPCLPPAEAIALLVGERLRLENNDELLERAKKVKDILSASPSPADVPVSCPMSKVLSSENRTRFVRRILPQRRPCRPRIAPIAHAASVMRKPKAYGMIARRNWCIGGHAGICGRVGLKTRRRTQASRAA